ncbi:hypothetical protein AU511_11305 [Lonsdalea iberica]|uniref:Uncharacterized protein n=1 Tax=Lonsdalea iberica TaxID=1082703 RepID=A0A1X3RT05_9GAMM|nr:hypothetical protein AU511_11305 [Lonsdalea iberica]
MDGVRMRIMYTLIKLTIAASIMAITSRRRKVIVIIRNNNILGKRTASMAAFYLAAIEIRVPK